MSYATIAKCSRDADFIDRVTACMTQEGNAIGSSDIYWTLSGKPDIEQAYAYALEVDNPAPGGDETVITDAMILSAVQAEFPPPIEMPLAEPK